jgi:peroxiredoxin
MIKKCLVALVVFVAQAASAALPFELPWMNGEPGAVYRSSDFPGAVFVLETYFLGCPYCNQNAPNVQELASEYSFDLRVQVLDVGIDQQDWQYEEWIRRHEPNHPVVKDVGRRLVRTLGTWAYPTVYVVDCNGRVAYRHEGMWNASVKAAIRSQIGTLLAGPCR